MPECQIVTATQPDTAAANIVEFANAAADRLTADAADIAIADQLILDAASFPRRRLSPLARGLQNALRFKRLSVRPTGAAEP